MSARLSRRMAVTATRVVVSCAIVLSSGCGLRIVRVQPPKPLTLFQLQNDSAYTGPVYAFMLCNECSDGQLTSVIGLGQNTVPLLRSILKDGPPPAHMAKLRASLSEPVPTGSIPSSPAAIQLQIDDVTSTYRIRSAEALARIGGSGAHDALCEGQAAHFARPQVRQAIDSALVRVGGSCP